jgi:hypothetical protein
LDFRSPLSVGNGRFAFTPDVTGLQTFAEYYEDVFPLCTQAEWGWHSFPNPDGHSLANFRMTPFEAHGRTVSYPVSGKGQEAAYQWLRENPHRMHLGRIGFRLIDLKNTLDVAGPNDIHETEQTLDLWNGVLLSRFLVGATPVHVETWCHPESDVVAVRVVSDLVRERRLGIFVEFPYASPEMSAANWNAPTRHTTEARRRRDGQIDFQRDLDDTRYYAALRYSGKETLLRETAHRFSTTASAGSQEFSFCCGFSHEGSLRLPSAGATAQACRKHWNRFWSTGGTVSLGSSGRAQELERRVVLSQYQTAIQCAGSMPPQETGLACNSWHGKFHLEMHWWHAAHFAVWGRTPQLEHSLSWYRGILARATETARKQGYAGARWPKMVGPDGRESPSPIGPLLIWQQPHPILMAELCYRSVPRRETLEKYRAIVFASADFMASYAVRDSASGRYVLGSPVIPAQENHPPNETWNPTYELEYWAQGLRTAQAWRVLLGLAPKPEWDTVADALADLPVKDGVYLAHENCPQTFTERNADHPSMLAALGVLDGRKVDRETMRRTLRKVLATWKWPTTWGWDYPVMAMTAARLDEPSLAVECLLLDTPKNTWLKNGHTWQRPNLPCYLPSNGALLLAVGMMAGSAAFPKDWRVKVEGIQEYGWSV